MSAANINIILNTTVYARPNVRNPIIKIRNPLVIGNPNCTIIHIPIALAYINWNNNNINATNAVNFSIVFLFVYYLLTSESNFSISKFLINSDTSLIFILILSVVIGYSKNISAISLNISLGSIL